MRELLPSISDLKLDIMNWKIDIKKVKKSMIFCLTTCSLLSLTVISKTLHFCRSSSDTEVKCGAYANKSTQTNVEKTEQEVNKQSVKLLQSHANLAK